MILLCEKKSVFIFHSSDWWSVQKKMEEKWNLEFSFHLVWNRGWISWHFVFLFTGHHFMLLFVKTSLSSKKLWERDIFLFFLFVGANFHTQIFTGTYNPCQNSLCNHTLLFLFSFLKIAHSKKTTNNTCTNHYGSGF